MAPSNQPTARLFAERSTRSLGSTTSSSSLGVIHPAPTRRAAVERTQPLLSLLRDAGLREVVRCLTCGPARCKQDFSSWLDKPHPTVHVEKVARERLREVGAAHSRDDWVSAARPWE